MPDDQVFVGLTEIVATVGGINRVGITPQASLADLGLDSLAMSTSSPRTGSGCSSTTMIYRSSGRVAAPPARSNEQRSALRG